MSGIRLEALDCTSFCSHFRKRAREQREQNVINFRGRIIIAYYADKTFYDNKSLVKLANC